MEEGEKERKSRSEGGRLKGDCSELFLYVHSEQRLCPIVTAHTFRLWEMFDAFSLVHAERVA